MTKVDFFDSKTCTLIGLVTNVALATFKLLAGIFGFSYAMIADAIHSFSDCFATATCYVGIRIGERPADEGHPYGHANAETIAAFLIALTILGAGIFVAVEAVQLIVAKDYQTPAVIALIAAVISIVIKEGMFRYTLKVGERNNSPAVIACAWDHRSDAYSSVAVLFGILGARLGFPYLDPVAGLAVSALIIKMSVSLLRSNVGILMDETPGSAVLDEIRAMAMKVKGVKAIDRLKVHRRGSAITIDIEVAVDSKLAVEQGHQAAAEVRSKLLSEVEHVEDVMVHVNPREPRQSMETGWVMLKAARDSSLVEKILGLKKERNAIILAHNYQLGEVQDIADFVGDSLELSQNAAKTDASVIVFCGVHFMAETASILCPEKTVLLPDIDAGCPMANMITTEHLREKKKEYPKAKVVCYINSSAEVKAESDVCCTSANAVRVVESLAAEEVLFVPDQYLGDYISTKTDKKMVLWPGFCPTHARILPEHITELRQEYPEAKVVVHPECKPEVIALADEVLSTGGMIRFAQRQEIREMIVGTEIGIIHRLKKENPGKRFIHVSEQAVCPNMKLITLEKVLWSLEEMAPEVKVPEKIRLRAKAAVDKMLEIGRG